MNKLLFVSLLMTTLIASAGCKKSSPIADHSDSVELVFRQVCVPPSITPKPGSSRELIACYELALKNPPVNDSVRVRSITLFLQIVNPVPNSQFMNNFEIDIDGVMASYSRYYDGDSSIFFLRNEELVLKKGTMKKIEVWIDPRSNIPVNNTPGTATHYSAGTIYCWGNVGELAALLINKNESIPASFTIPKSVGVKIL